MYRHCCQLLNMPDQIQQELVFLAQQSANKHISIIQRSTLADACRNIYHTDYMIHGNTKVLHNRIYCMCYVIVDCSPY